MIIWNFANDFRKRSIIYKSCRKSLLFLYERITWSTRTIKGTSRCVYQDSFDFLEIVLEFRNFQRMEIRKYIRIYPIIDILWDYLVPREFEPSFFHFLTISYAQIDGEKDVGKNKGRAYLWRQSRRRKESLFPGASSFRARVSIFRTITSRASRVSRSRASFNSYDHRDYSNVSSADQPIDSPGWSAITTLSRSMPVQHFLGTGRWRNVLSSLADHFLPVRQPGVN